MKTKKHKSRSRRHLSVYDLMVGDRIEITTNSLTDECIVIERNEFFAVLENPNKQKLYKLSLSTGNLIDISPAFPVDVQKAQEQVQS